MDVSGCGVSGRRRNTSTHIGWRGSFSLVGPFLRVPWFFTIAIIPDAVDPGTFIWEHRKKTWPIGKRAIRKATNNRADREVDSRKEGSNGKKKEKICQAVHRPVPDGMRTTRIRGKTSLRPLSE
jgi:hypothetical protein